MPPLRCLPCPLTTASSCSTLRYRSLVKPGPTCPVDQVKLQDAAVAKEKGIKFYNWWTGPYLIPLVTRGMSFVLQEPHEKALYGTHHRDDIRPWAVHPEHLWYLPGAPMQPEILTNYASMCAPPSADRTPAGVVWPPPLSPHAPATPLPLVPVRCTLVLPE